MTFGPNRVTDPDGVASLILEKFTTKRKGSAIAHGRFSASKRKILFNPPAPPLVKIDGDPLPPEPKMFVDTNTDHFLRDMATAWRRHRRNHDRASAATVLQLTLKAIPKRSGRVSDWLGPSFFDEVLPVIPGCRVRVLSKSDYDQGTRFRNSFENTCLGECNDRITLVFSHIIICLCCRLTDS